MAEDSKEPPDVFSNENHKCHPKKVVTTVICIICENVYHRSCFEKINNTKYVGDHLIICPEHLLSDLTSKTDEYQLSDVAKKVIASIKLKKSEEIREELLQEIHNKTVERHNTTIRDEEYEMDSLIKENTLLRQLVAELQEKNQLQKYIIDTQKDKNLEYTSNKKSYASVLNEVHSKEKPKGVPKILVKVKSPNQTNSLNSLTHQLVNEKGIQTKYIRKKNDQEYEINCMNLESVKTAEKVLSTKLVNCDVKIEQPNKPKIKIIGIDNTTKMDKDKLEQDINCRNFKHLDSDGKILHVSTNKKNNTSTVLMEVSAGIYKHIRENNNRVFVGHQCCKAFDLINIAPCFNCGRFGHSGAKCRNELICIRCCKNHKLSECKHDKTECLNCVFNNTKYKTKLPTDHLPIDSSKCSVLKNKLKKFIDSTDYPIQPVLPIWDELKAIKIINRQQMNNLPLRRLISTSPPTSKTPSATQTPAQQVNCQQLPRTPTTPASNTSSSSKLWINSTFQKL